MLPTPGLTKSLNLNVLKKLFRRRLNGSLNSSFKCETHNSTLNYSFDYRGEFFKAESGSALHEAALYGKVEVVKLLLDYGIDVNLENNSKRTVFDLLEDLNTAISKQISRIIRDHTTAVGKVDDTSKSPYSTSPPSSFSSVSTFVPTPEKQSSLLPLVRSGSPMSEATDTICSYNSSKRSSTASDTLRKSQGSSSEHLSMSSRSPSVYETPPLPRDYDAVSVHSTSMYESRDVVTAFTESQGLSTFSPPDPQGPPSRISVPPGWKPLPPAKPPRKSITSLSPSGKTQHHIRQSSVTYDSTSQNQMMYDPSDIMMPRTPPSGFANSDSSSLHHQPPISHSSTNQTQNASSQQQQQLSNGKLSESPFSALYDEMASGKITTGGISSLLGPKAMHRRRLTGEGLRPDKPIPPAKPKTLDLRTKRQTVQIPLSPTHYQQPPTPDFPPPSPSTAALGIHEKIRPLSQRLQKRENLTLNKRLRGTLGIRGVCLLSLKTSQSKNHSLDNSLRRVIDKLEVSQSQVKKGRHRATAPAQDRYLALRAWRHRRITASQLARDLAALSGRRISRQTVYKRLAENGIYTRRPVVDVFLTASNRKHRLLRS
ncbi:ankyrin repeat and sterile alpha motif domain-containing protein 1B [Trichonephila clavipes]|nr:ankyrin repeat and sterile alpha motif domain-containing protein 1B [Trichonephila clavipes]